MLFRIAFGATKCYLHRLVLTYKQPASWMFCILNHGGKTFPSFILHLYQLLPACVASKCFLRASYTTFFFLSILRHSSLVRQKLLSIGSTGCLHSLLMQSKTQSLENGSISNVPLLWQCQTGNGIWKTKPSESGDNREAYRIFLGKTRRKPKDACGLTDLFFSVLGALRGSSISQSSSSYKVFTKSKE